MSASKGEKEGLRHGTVTAYEREVAVVTKLRRVLGWAGVLAVGVVLTGCGSSQHSDAAKHPSSSSRPAAGASGPPPSAGSLPPAGESGGIGAGSPLPSGGPLPGGSVPSSVTSQPSGVPLQALLEVSPSSGGAGTAILLLASNCPKPSGLAAGTGGELLSGGSGGKPAVVAQFARSQLTDGTAIARYTVRGSDVVGSARAVVECGGTLGNATAPFTVTAPKS